MKLKESCDGKANLRKGRGIELRLRAVGEKGRLAGFDVDLKVFHLQDLLREKAHVREKTKCTQEDQTSCFVALKCVTHKIKEWIGFKPRITEPTIQDLFLQSNKPRQERHPVCELRVLVIGPERLGDNPLHAGGASSIIESIGERRRSSICEDVDEDIGPCESALQELRGVVVPHLDGDVGPGWERGAGCGPCDDRHFEVRCFGE
jgi:hypothetical protein